MGQQKRRKPGKVVVPKPRQFGATTYCLSRLLFRAKIRPYTDARVFGHTDKDVKIIFEKAQLMHEKSSGKKLAKDDLASWKIEPPGSNSILQCGTAGGRGTGRGGTPDAALLTEVAHYQATSGQDEEFVESTENAIGDGADTIIFIESTGNGDFGVYPDRAIGAYEGTNDYVCVFIRWTDDPNNSEDPDDVPDEWDPPLLGDELTLQEAGVAPEQLAWRRKKLRRNRHTDFSTTPQRFRWEFPFEFSDVFSMPTGRVFPGLSREKHERNNLALKDFGPRAFIVRGIDWGNTKDHKFVCEWAIVDPDKPPGFSIDQKCEVLWRELTNLHWKPRTSTSTRAEPIKKHDDTADCSRYIVFPKDRVVRGHIHFFNEYVVSDFLDGEINITTHFREIMRMSGYVHPAGFDGEAKTRPGYRDMSLFKPGPDAMKIKYTIVDRAGLANIGLFNIWGMPLTPYDPPEDISTSHEKGAGIEHMNWLITGESDYKQPPVDKDAILLEEAIRLMHGGPRSCLLTPEQQRVYDRHVKVRRTPTGKPPIIAMPLSPKSYR